MTRLRELVAQLSETGTTAGALKVDNVVVALVAAALGGLIIYLAYRFFYRGVVYSENFGVLIVLMSIVTAFIILTIGSNLVLSLGMVGALSIVRFRAAVKDPLDVGFLYWAVAVGLTAGAGLEIYALLGSAATALLYIAMTYLRKEKRSFLFILQFASADEDEIAALLLPLRHKLKNRSSTADSVELTVEVKLRKNDTSPLRPLMSHPLVRHSSLVEFIGDYS